MAERHDNTRPCRDGTYSVSADGLISYFPIERSAFLKPFVALIIKETPNGQLVALIDTRWAELGHEIDIRE